MMQAREAMERTYELLQRSNERIRISLELLAQDVPSFVRLEPVPICKQCDIGMTWSRSALSATAREIVHVFACSRCGEVAATKTRAKMSFEPIPVIGLSR